MSETVTVLVGTTKGLFLLRADGIGWRVSGPHCPGWVINHTAADGATGRIWAVGGDDWTGAGVWRSEDDGQSWSLTKLSDGAREDWARSDPDAARALGIEPEPPAPFSGEVAALWSVMQAGHRLYAGGKPGRLYCSDDDGQSWRDVPGINAHPERDSWNPGGAGMIVHTLLTDPAAPDRIWLAISAAGVFASENGGQSWERRNRLANEATCGDHTHPAAPRDGETGHCVHNMVRADIDGDLLYQQNHHGVWRSPDGGRSWEDITAGLPSPFGFPIAVHPFDPDTIWTLPLNGDSAGRYPPEGSAAVWRSRDGGRSWRDCRTGLPQSACFFTVLRQAMAVDASDNPGLFFGTNSGSVFASFDEADSWCEIARHLPTVLSVETVTRLS